MGLWSAASTMIHSDPHLLVSLCNAHPYPSECRLDVGTHFYITEYGKNNFEIRLFIKRLYCGLSFEWLLSCSYHLLCCEALYGEICVARKLGGLLINGQRGTEVLSLTTCKELNSCQQPRDWAWKQIFFPLKPSDETPALTNKMQSCETLMQLGCTHIPHPQKL